MYFFYSKYCKKKDILYMCTPWDLKSIEVLESFGVKAYKVASADLTNLPLLDQLSKTNKPLILSTGMSKVEEVKQVKLFLEKRNVEFVFLHCNSTYPAPFHDINLNWIKSLKDGLNGCQSRVAAMNAEIHGNLPMRNASSVNNSSIAKNNT